MAMTGERREVYSAYTFLVEVDGDQGSAAYFRSVSGLSSKAEVVPMQQGGVNDIEHKLIGRTSYANLILKRGLATGDGWGKRLRFISNDSTPIKRFNGSITQLGPGMKPVHRWQFVKGWVCKWEGPEFDAAKNEVSIETIEIAHEGLIML